MGISPFFVSIHAKSEQAFLVVQAPYSSLLELSFGLSLYYGITGRGSTL